LGRRPKGAVTNQPRATPWDHVHHEHPGSVSGPKGQSQISPGQRPGTTSTTNIRALKGRNRIRFFTGDQTRQEPRIVAPFTGMRFLRIPVRRTLPWAGTSFPLRGGISNSATSKARERGDWLCVFRSRGSHTNPTRQRGDHRGRRPVPMLPRGNGIRAAPRRAQRQSAK
jgi:hypothetical protein